MTRTQQGELLYEKCEHCHLFVEDDEGVLMHLHRGDEADEAIDATHEPTLSGLFGTLDTWKRYGPPAMRARFVSDDADPFTAPVPDWIGVRLLRGTSWGLIDTDI
ncbi:MAG: hypothetical protein ABIQ39_02620 [Ilumatobacteraceae bacterium]